MLSFGSLHIVKTIIVNKNKLLILSFITLFVLTVIYAFDIEKKQASTTIYQRQQQRFEDFYNELARFNSFLPDNETSNEQLQSRFLRVREMFKKWEYLAEYNDAQFIKTYVNGAPLPKIVPNTANLEIADPRGLQVLDELVFSENIDDNRVEIIQETRMLLEELDKYSLFKQPVYDRTVLEAMRQQLLRIFTLGLTGFDVPASGNSINDAIASLKVMQEDFMLYEDIFHKTDEETTNTTIKTFTTFITYLQQHNDFDNLNRAFVLKQFIDPLYKDILHLHKESGIEMLHEVMKNADLPPYNHMSESLFSNNFLDQYKYIRLSPGLASDEMVELGKMLFFDPILSTNLQRSCASCHHADKGFTDGLAKSPALAFDGTVDRNAPTLINAVYSEKFFHDMRAEALEDQVDHVLSNRKEFDMDMLKIVARLNQSEQYVSMFADAFEKYSGDKIDPATVAFAISAYISSLRGFNSEFDKYIRGEINSVDQSVVNGFNLFMGKGACGTCHFAPVFNGTVPPLYMESESEVLGVPEDPYVATPVLDKDRGRIAGRRKDAAPFFEFSFKTPTVRNVALTAPYMHNGAYKTLEDVMDFYNNGGGKGIGINLAHQTLPFDSLSLNKEEINDIISFMKSLTDTTGMTSVPISLPTFTAHSEWNNRKVGGEY